MADISPPLTKEKVYNYIKTLRDSIPTGITEDYGATYKIDNRKFSKGCMACKTGTWICIFMGFDCNCNCEWCPQRKDIEKDSIIIDGGGSHDGASTKEDLDRMIKRVSNITGVSFSGGEPTLYIDKILEWASYISKKYPELYLWIYTNGILIDKKMVKALGEAGISEIRFDLAATDYSDKVIEKLSYIKDYVKYSCVEVPVMEWQVEKLLKTLPALDKYKVDYLNLRGLCVTPEYCNKHEMDPFPFNPANLQDVYVNHETNDKYGIDSALIYVDKFSNSCVYIPSIQSLYEIIRFIKDNDLKIIPNDCSIINMVNQYLGFLTQIHNYNNDEKINFIEHRTSLNKKGQFP